MTEFLVKKFVPDHNNTGDQNVRKNYGTLSSVVGIVCNIFLFVLKYAVGTVSASISVISDGFNNLSDAAGCIVTLIGYRMAAKPADKDHPFGHGRAEYLTSLIIAALIMLVGFELFIGSAGKIIAPEEVRASPAVIISLIASIGLKLWLSAFNGKLGRNINSPVMLASAADSRSDVIATSAALLGLTLSSFTSLPADGIMGIVVSLFILKAGYGIIKDTVDNLLGKPAEKELAHKIEEIVCSSEKIIGIHDLIIHNYGPGKMIASCHAELRSDESFVSAHDAADAAERKIYEILGIIMTIHTDPVDIGNEQSALCMETIQRRVSEIDSRICIHDFRMVCGELRTRLIFDLLIPYDLPMSDKELREKIAGFPEFKGENAQYSPVITLDRSYTDE